MPGEGGLLVSALSGRFEGFLRRHCLHCLRQHRSAQDELNQDELTKARMGTWVGSKTERRGSLLGVSGLPKKTPGFTEHGSQEAVWQMILLKLASMVESQMFLYPLIFCCPETDRRKL